MAFIARIKLFNLDRLLCAQSRLLKFDFHVVSQIRATTPIVRACPSSATKERLENSAAKSNAAEHFPEDLEWVMKPAAEAGATLRKRGVTEAIVCRALV